MAELTESVIIIITVITIIINPHPRVCVLVRERERERNINWLSPTGPYVPGAESHNLARCTEWEST